MTKIQIWTDGGCRGNPGPGGWGALMRAGEHERELSGSEPHTTNNRMEMSAVIAALQAIRREGSSVVLTTDSQYVRKGITEWIAGWKKRGWKTASKEPVKNADLWREIDALAACHDIEWRWVKGHAGHPENERCDALANAAMDALRAGRAGRAGQAGQAGSGGARRGAS